MDRQDEILQRLTRIETKLENGILHEIGSIKEWIEEWSRAHPRECPLEKRKNTYVVPVVVAVLTAAALRGVDVILRVVP